ncbi:hypothetical protein BCR34DRAFT_113925 [Clohesyomyces aquaticus]|uniref:Uncharacterized protein n=1 Tax=Clohesyomyces aquaticus TaxID=1231657 RepID=A0A1Y1YRL1_9PLEO|nr:hypothetical protein BCR34DRAFT_113925 [Clohesyomyces aquaticus]
MNAGLTLVRILVRICYNVQAVHGVERVRSKAILTRFDLGAHAGPRRSLRLTNCGVAFSFPPAPIPACADDHVKLGTAPPSRVVGNCLAIFVVDHVPPGFLSPWLPLYQPSPSPAPTSRMASSSSHQPRSHPSELSSDSEAYSHQEKSRRPKESTVTSSEARNMQRQRSQALDKSFLSPSRGKYTGTKVQSQIDPVTGKTVDCNPDHRFEDFVDERNLGEEQLERERRKKRLWRRVKVLLRVSRTKRRMYTKV